MAADAGEAGGGSGLAADREKQVKKLRLMLQAGAPLGAVEQKAMLEGIDMSLVLSPSEEKDAHGAGMNESISLDDDTIGITGQPNLGGVASNSSPNEDISVLSAGAGSGPEPLGPGAHHIAGIEEEPAAAISEALIKKYKCMINDGAPLGAVQQLASVETGATPEQIVSILKDEGQEKVASEEMKSKSVSRAATSRPEIDESIALDDDTMGIMGEPTLGGVASNSSPNEDVSVLSASAGSTPASLGPGAHHIAAIEASDRIAETTHPINESTEFQSGTLSAEVGGDPEDPQVEAYLVDDDSQHTPITAHASPILPFYQRKEGKVTMLVVGTLIVIVVIILIVFLTRDSEDQSASEELGTLSPSSFPSMAPSEDTRPTLQIVQDRNALNCGVEDVSVGGAFQFGQFTADLCRSLAAVVLGNPEKVNLITVGDDRFDVLASKAVDVLIAGDIFTLDKYLELPIIYTYPYYLAAVVYVGLPEFVQCANDGKRYDECAALSICAIDAPEIKRLILTYFPSSFVTFGSFNDMYDSLLNGTCNVLTTDLYRVYGSDIQTGLVASGGEYVISDNHISLNDISQVTRNDDVEWWLLVESTRSMNWRFSQLNITQNVDLCPYAEEIPTLEEMSFFNSPYCVGNFQEIFARSLGTTSLGYGVYIPALHAPNFGSLECDDCPNALETPGLLKKINDRGYLNCGVFTGSMPDLTNNSLPILMSKKMCEIFAVAIFQGDSNAVNVTYFDEIDYFGFDEDEFDVVTGGSADDAYGFDPARSTKTIEMNLPYFIYDKFTYDGKVYDGIGKSLGPLITVEDPVFHFFMTYIMAGLIYAQREGITRATSVQMPQVETLGGGLTFMLRDVIAFAGNYDEVVYEALAVSDGTYEVGWNQVIQTQASTPKTPVSLCDLAGTCGPCTPFVVDGAEFCLSGFF